MADQIFAVIGATGAQGGGTARALLARPDRRFAVRALTRKTSSDAAQALAAAGAEVVAADLDDRDTLRAALVGATALFAVTNFWEHMSPDRELTQAAHIAAAADDAGVKHVVWSTLEDTRQFIPLDDDRLPTLMERFKVPHFDAKGEADALFRDRSFATTFLYTSFYWDNLIGFGMGPKRNAEGTLDFVLPMGDRPLPGIVAEDIGACAAALMARGPDGREQSVGISAGHLTGAQMAAALSIALGESVRHVSPTRAQYAAFGFPGADDLANMFAFKALCNEAFCARRPVEATRALVPGLTDFEGWLARHKAALMPAS